MLDLADADRNGLIQYGQFVAVMVCRTVVVHALIVVYAGKA